MAAARDEASPGEIARRLLEVEVVVAGAGAVGGAVAGVSAGALALAVGADGAGGVAVDWAWLTSALNSTAGARRTARVVFMMESWTSES
jgi:hypothetical protein